ncbi:hypothetical protein ACFL3T_02095 [Patescibacteria group bacterium]
MKKIVAISMLAVLLFTFNACVKPAATFDDAANQTITTLKNKDLDTLETLIHPEKGVRLSPYATVDTKKDVILKPFELNDGSSRLWGQYDGTGLPITLTLNEYFDKFVFSADFENAPQIKKNEIIGSGNSLNNLEKVYGEANFIEYHFPEFDPEMYGMDWQSLRLVFEEYEGEFKLVGIIHDQWTI